MYGTLLPSPCSNYLPARHREALRPSDDIIRCEMKAEKLHWHIGKREMWNQGRQNISWKKCSFNTFLSSSESTIYSFEELWVTLAPSAFECVIPGSCFGSVIPPTRCYVKMTHSSDIPVTTALSGVPSIRHTGVLATNRTCISFFLLRFDSQWIRLSLELVTIVKWILIGWCGLLVFALSNVHV